MEGLKLTVLGNELKALYLARAKDYRNRAEDFRKMASRMADAAQEIVDEEPSEFSYANTIQSRAARTKGDYTKLARERDLQAKRDEFFAAHLLPEERYVVNPGDVLDLIQ